MKLRSLAAVVAGVAAAAVISAACSSDDTSQKTPTPLPTTQAVPSSVPTSPSPTPTAVPPVPVPPSPTAVPAPIATAAPVTAPAAPATAVPAPPLQPALAPAPANLSDLLQRIVLLTDTGRLAPTLAGISVQLGLPASGGSSLLGNADGKLLVEVRQRSGQDLSAIRALGQIVSTAADQSTLTVAIEPERLRDLAGLPVVLSARELIRPSTGADSRP